MFQKFSPNQEAGNQKSREDSKVKFIGKTSLYSLTYTV